LFIIFVIASLFFIHEFLTTHPLSPPLLPSRKYVRRAPLWL
jgi:hypothetical protein